MKKVETKTIATDAMRTVSKGFKKSTEKWN